MIDFKKIEKMIPLPKATKETLLLRAFGLTKIPLLFLTSPRVIELTDSSCRILIPFRKIVKNHWGSMYFGTLAIGADACVAMHAIDKISKTGKKINVIFKSFNAEFLKRAEGDTIFICNEGEKIDQLIAAAIQSGERESEIINAVAMVNSEEVARFQLELSIKSAL